MLRISAYSTLALQWGLHFYKCTVYMCMWHRPSLPPFSSLISSPHDFSSLSRHGPRETGWWEKVTSLHGEEGSNVNWGPVLWRKYWAVALLRAYSVSSGTSEFLSLPHPVSLLWPPNRFPFSPYGFYDLPYVHLFLFYRAFLLGAFILFYSILLQISF